MAKTMNLIALSLSITFSLFLRPALAETSPADTIVPRDFSFTIGADSAKNQNCLSINVNGATTVTPATATAASAVVPAWIPLGCNNDSIKSKTVSLSVYSQSFNVFRFLMTSQAAGGKLKTVFNSASNQIASRYDYLVNSKTEHMIDFSISENGIAVNGYNATLQGPQDIKFVVDYLKGAGCTPNGKLPYLSISDLPNSNPGTAVATVTVKESFPVAQSGTPDRPLGVIDAFVPGTGVISHINITQNNFALNTSHDFLLHYHNIREYPGIQIRVCSFGQPLEFVNLSTQFNDDVPFTNIGGGTPGIAPIDPTPDLSGQAVIHVDLSHPIQKTKNSLSGLMHGIQDTPRPKFFPGVPVPTVQQVTEIVRPLKLGLWRAGPHVKKGLDYALGSKTPTVALLTGLWPATVDDQTGYWGTGVHGGPYDNLPQWESLVKNFAQQYPSVSFIDLWNEPQVGTKSDGSWPPKATPHNLFDTLVGAAKGLHQSGVTGIKMGGPGFSAYSHDYIEHMLDYVLEAHQSDPSIELNVLAWHELSSSQDYLYKIEEDLQDARALISKPKYAPLKIQEIQINESVGQAGALVPGEQIATLYHLQQGGADRACKDGWYDSHGVHMTKDGSISGMFIPPNIHHGNPINWYKPRTSYWVYKTYGDIYDQSIPCNSNNKNIVCFAGGTDPITHEAKVLIGYNGTRYNFPDADLQIDLKGIGQDLAPNGTVHVKLERLPNLGEKPMAHLPAYRSGNNVGNGLYEGEDRDIAGGKIQINLSALAVHEGVIVTLSPPGQEVSIKIPFDRTQGFLVPPTSVLTGMGHVIPNATLTGAAYSKSPMYQPIVTGAPFPFISTDANLNCPAGSILVGRQAAQPPNQLLCQALAPGVTLTYMPTTLSGIWQYDNFLVCPPGHLAVGFHENGYAHAFYLNCAMPRVKMPPKVVAAAP